MLHPPPRNAGRNEPEMSVADGQAAVCSCHGRSLIWHYRTKPDYNIIREGYIAIEDRWYDLLIDRMQKQKAPAKPAGAFTFTVNLQLEPVFKAHGQEEVVFLEFNFRPRSIGIIDIEGVAD